MNFPEALGIEIAAERKRHYVTQTELYMQSTCPVSRSQVSNIERGHSLPALDTYIDICAALDPRDRTMPGRILNRAVKRWRTE